MKTVDMDEQMEKDAIEVATFALNEHLEEKLMANHIKKEFDKKYRCERSISVSPFFFRRACPSRGEGCHATPPAPEQQSAPLTAAGHSRACAARHGTWWWARTMARTWSTRPSTSSTFTLGRRPSCSSRVVREPQAAALQGGPQGGLRHGRVNTRRGARGPLAAPAVRPRRAAGYRALGDILSLSTKPEAWESAFKNVFGP